MSSDNAKIHPLFAVPDASAAAEDTNAAEGSGLIEQPDVCQFCFGSGMEVVAGKGARRCRCRTQSNLAKLLEAARIPRRYSECSLQNFFPVQGKYYTNQGNAFRFAYTLAR